MPAETQRDFIDAVMHADRPVIAGARDPKGNHAPKRFNVYRNNVIVSLVEALGEGFPLTLRLVGEDFFKSMARVYVEDHPPRSPLMFLYGDDFPDFVRGFEPAKSVVYLADIATLEYQRRQSYFAEDKDALDLQSLGEEAIASGGFVLHPSAFVLASRYPVFDIYQRLRDPVHPLSKEAQEVLTFRRQGEVQTVQAPTGMAEFAMLMSQNPFGEAIEKFAAAYPEADLPSIINQTMTVMVTK